MKNLLIIGFLFLTTTKAVSQDVIEKPLPSSLNEVTVYFQGAQLERTSTFSAQKGTKYRFLVQGVETGMIRSSLQLSSPAGFSITQVTDRIKYVETVNHDPETSALNEKISKLKTQLIDQEDFIELVKTQKSMLDENRGLAKTQSGMSVEEWKSGVAFYETKTSELRTRLRDYERKSLTIKAEMQKHIDRLDEITGTAKKQTIEVIIDGVCTESISNGTLRLTYLVPEASWSPKYDLRMIDLDRPLELDVNALVSQSTGMDWSNVKMVLTSEDPFKSSERPTLIKWNPQSGYRPSVKKQNKLVQMSSRAQIQGQIKDNSSGDPVAFANVVLMDGDQMVTGTSTDFAGKYRFKDVPTGTRYTVKASFIGYSNEIRDGVIVNANGTTTVDFRLRPASVSLNDVVKMPGRGAETKVSSISGIQDSDGAVGSIRGTRDGSTDTYIDGVKVRGSYIEGGDVRQASITNKVTRVNYQLKERQTVPSAPDPQTIKVDGLRVGALFEHFSAPVEVDKAFLISKITGWEDFNLLNGPVSIHVDGTYIGESSLYAGRVDDTLVISLGTDSKLIIERKKVDDQSKKPVLGNKITRTKSYRMVIRNKRTAPVRIIVQDQIPVASDKEIEIVLEESGGAKLDSETGILEWDVTIEPGKVWETTFRYSAKHPKDMRVYLD
ncbi:MAG: mucoidy inhibitor MuiA family protein [Flavobacteriales bacterium]|nr:mucoidy inhibitor MuiA family protein [Flavobacteriales bacterium]